jgi:hypothetical protein
MNKQLYQIQYRDAKGDTQTYKENIKDKQEAINEVVFLNCQSKVKYFVHL